MRRMWWLAVVVVVAIVAAACSDSGGSDSSDDSQGTDEQSQTTDEPSTEESGAAAPDDEDAEPLGYDDTIDQTFQDVHEYWSDEFALVYPDEAGWTALPNSRIVAFTEDTRPFRCGPYRVDYSVTQDNAAYLPPCDTVVYDDEGLMPQLFEDYGNFSPALVISHELGHRVQGHVLTKFDFQNTAESIGIELQADCFAGAWTSYVDSGESNLLVLEPGDLDIGIAGYLQFRDPPGSDPQQQGAHGTAFDRVNAFQEGYEQGPERCAEYIDGRGRVVGPGPDGLFDYIDIQFEDPTDDGDVGLGKAVRFTGELLDAYWPLAYGGYRPIEEVIPYQIDDPDDVDPDDLEDAACGDEEPDPEALDDKISYCEEENSIAFDVDLLEEVYDDTGDFGVATLIGEQYAHAVALQQGVEGDDIDVNLYADCLNGSWAGAAYNNVLDTEDQVVLSPGDLDEVVQALLAFRDEVDTETPVHGTAFQRIDAFRTGFFGGGANACAPVLNGDAS